MIIIIGDCHCHVGSSWYHSRGFNRNTNMLLLNTSNYSAVFYSSDNSLMYSFCFFVFLNLSCFVLPLNILTTFPFPLKCSPGLGVSTSGNLGKRYDSILSPRSQLIKTSLCCIISAGFLPKR